LNPLALWVLLGVGLVFFFYQTALIGFSAEEQFSFPAGPGSKLYDSAVALTTLNALFVSCWSLVLNLSWRRCRHHPDTPTRSTLLLCFGRQPPRRPDAGGNSPTTWPQ
jgi:hypothetical protein